MNRSQLTILSQLASSPNDVASGLAQCIEALRLVSSLPRSSPIMVAYLGMKGSIIKAFGREHLSRVPFRTVVRLLKASMELPEDSRVMYAAFYREDGTVDPAKVLIDEDSWKELASYVHTLHIEDDRQAHSAFATQDLSSGTSQCTRSSRSPSPALTSPIRSLNCDANAFVPSKNTVRLKSQDGTKVNLRALGHRGRISPASVHPVSSLAGLADM